MRNAVGMPHREFELSNELVVVGDFRSGDEEPFVAWASDEAIYEFMAWRLESPEAARAEFARLLFHPERTAARRRHWYLAVVDGAGEFVGITAFDHRPDGLGEIGWYLSTAHWGRGHASAITALLLQFGFADVGVPAVTATCDPENNASRRVLEKSGLSLSGEEEIETWCGGGPRLRFTITAEDYGAAIR